MQDVWKEPQGSDAVRRLTSVQFYFTRNTIKVRTREKDEQGAHILSKNIALNARHRSKF